MIANLQPDHPAFRAAGQAALKALMDMARTKGDKLVHEHEAEVGRKVLAALTPLDCAKQCPFFFATILKGTVRTGCWLNLRPVWRGRCPLHPRQVTDGPFAQALGAALDKLANPTETTTGGHHE